MHPPMGVGHGAMPADVLWPFHDEEVRGAEGVYVQRGEVFGVCEAVGVGVEGGRCGVFVLLVNCVGGAGDVFFGAAQRPNKMPRESAFACT